MSFSKKNQGESSVPHVDDSLSSLLADLRDIPDPPDVPPPPEIELPPQYQQSHHDLPRPAPKTKKKVPAWLPRALIGVGVVVVIILLIVLAPKPQSAEELAVEGDTPAEANTTADEETANEETSDDTEAAADEETNPEDTDTQADPEADSEAANDTESDEEPAETSDRSFPVVDGNDDERNSESDPIDTDTEEDEPENSDDEAALDSADARADPSEAATPRPATRPDDSAEPTTTPLPGTQAPPARNPQARAAEPTTTPLPQSQPPGAEPQEAGDNQPLLVFQDVFDDNRNAWTTGRFNDMETSSIDNGVLRVQWDSTGSSYEIYQGQVFVNFIAEMECAVIKGGDDASCGIILTANQSEGAYEFEVLNSLYRLGYYNQQGEALEIPLTGDPAGIIKPNQTNRLRIEHSNSETRLYLNNQLLDSTSSVVLPTGHIGVSTNSYTEQGAEIVIDNLTIWTLP